MEPNLVQNTPQTQEITPESSSSKNKFLILGLIAFLLLILFSLGLYFLNRSNEAKNKEGKTVSTKTTANPSSETKIEDPKSISFIRNGDIWTANLDGSNEKQITNNGNVWDYRWIPNTNKIIYYTISRTNNTVSISILDTDNNQETLIRQNPIPRGDLVGSFRLSPDGKKLLLGGVLVGNSNELHLYDLETNTEKVIISGAAYSNAIFSPDSKQLALIDSTDNIIVLSLEDGSKKTLTNFATLEEIDIRAGSLQPSCGSSASSCYDHPQEVLAWMPNGKDIIYNFGDAGQGAQEQHAYLYKINVDTKKTTKLTQSGPGLEGTFFDIGKDGKTIYYRVGKETIVDSKGKIAGSDVSKLSGYELFQKGYSTQTYAFIKSTNLESGKTISLLSLPEGVYLGTSETIKALPSGKQIIYSFFNESNTKNEIRTMNADGANNHKILDNATNPQWKI
jgi:hypothetical protein